MKNLLPIIILQVLALGSCWGNNLIKGWVTDEGKLPLGGVGIYVDNGDRLIGITDSKGQYVVEISEDITVYRLHMIGFADTTLVADSKEHHIRMRETVECLGEVTVQGQQALTSSSIWQSRSEQRQIAGSTSIAEIKCEERKVTTLKEALSMQPGVMVQEFFGGNDQPRLNIRGSGIQSNPQRRGVTLLQDGIPVNFADGSYIVGVMDPMTNDYVEVFKGANALKFGSSTLGGALNFISRTGLSAPRLLVKAEGGSFKNRAVTLAGGYAWNNWDAYLNVAYSGQEGWRTYNENNRLNLAGNLGWHSDDKRWENRSYLNFTYLKFQFPGALNMSQINEDASQVNHGVDLPFCMGPDVLRDKPGRFSRMVRFADKSGFHINSKSSISFSLYYQYADDEFIFPITLSIPHSYHNDWGANLNYKVKLGRNNLQTGVVASYGKIDRRNYINKNGKESFMFAWNDLTAKNLTLFAEDNLTLGDKWHLVADLHGIYTVRNSEDVFPDPSLRPWYSHMSHKYRYFYSEDISLNQSWCTLNPRMGFVFNPSDSKDIQVFGNVSRSYEPPTFDELVGTQVTSNINTSPKKLYAIKLDKQLAWTYEAGTKGRCKWTSWNLAYYYSQVENEILEVKDYVKGVKATENYPHSVHQGFEAGVSIKIFDKPFAWNLGCLIWGFVYNWSDFRFKDGKYDGKQIAGVPRHFVNNELTYSHPCGLQLTASCEWKADETPIDHTNTMFQPAYHVWNGRASFKFSEHLSVYGEVKNIADLVYASSYVVSDEIHEPAITYPKFDKTKQTYFIPGSPRSFYLGLTWKL